MLPNECFQELFRIGTFDHLRRRHERVHVADVAPAPHPEPSFHELRLQINDRSSRDSVLEKALDMVSFHSVIFFEVFRTADESGVAPEYEPCVVTVGQRANVQLPRLM